MHQVTAVVPVKPLALAKTRLALPRAQRRRLALAFAVDTISSLSASRLVSGVVVVTPDLAVARRVRELGAHVAPEEGAGLGAAVRWGIELAVRWRPSSGVAVVPADLPCLRAEDVTAVLSGAAAPEGAFVPDRRGTGTTLLVHPRGRTAETSYGPGSAARHSLLGLHRLDDAPPRTRHDVDTLEDLRSAARVGTGPETAAVLESLGIPGLDLADGLQDVIGHGGAR